jgi:hypothetical protein
MVMFFHALDALSEKPTILAEIIAYLQRTFEPKPAMMAPKLCYQKFAL